MKIVDLIRREMLLPSLRSTDKNGIIRELAGLVSANHPNIDRDELTRVLIERESLASTAIGEGVAIPHGKLATVDHIVAGLARIRRGVDFDSMDGQPTYLFFVLVAPEASTGAHLKALARISRVFKNADFRRRLLSADDADGMYEVIEEEDAKY
ncbi:PTS sugar transporter subunit IIA [Haliangium sp.]|uniref:PTS sugar transporter subunit IIA n=1 Tax=Haliangium sp. TaxID=2663208 RepID=UPI003D0EEB9A